MKDKDKVKYGIYGGNFLFPSLISMTKDISSKIIDKVHFTGAQKLAESANPWGALGFGVLDVVSEVSDKFKNHAFPRAAKFGGFGWYAGNVVNDVLEIGRGNYPYFANLVFDGSMAYQLGKDTFENYSKKTEGKKNDIIDDLKLWNWFKK